MSNWKERVKAYKKGMGYKNKDIAKKLKRTLNSVEVSITRDNLSDTFKLAIITYEDMMANGRIVYNKPKVIKSKPEKK